MVFDELLVAAKTLLAQNAKLEAGHAGLETQKASLEAKVSRMQFQIDQLTRLIYGAKRERFIAEMAFTFA